MNISISEIAIDYSTYCMDLSRYKNLSKFNWWYTKDPQNAHINIVTNTRDQLWYTVFRINNK